MSFSKYIPALLILSFLGMSVLIVTLAPKEAVVVFAAVLAITALAAGG